jgi:toxin-antitoxin system PIN domain toxin
VLVYAQRGGTPENDRIAAWLEALVNGDAPYALSSVVLSGALRILTHPRVFARPTPVRTAIQFVESLRDRPNCVEAAPGPRHWRIFADLCRTTDARGNRVPDAYLAALAIEFGSEWVTTDRDFARFPGLSWRHPLS